MKSSAPWSVKGIERDARETAKEAAKREGMTVGEWLNQIIYTAGSGEETDGEIEGLKLRDLVTAVEHLNKRIGETENKNADSLGALSRNIGGVVERVQRLERTKAPEDSDIDLAERVEKLERAGGDRERIEALKALEKAVTQVASQFNTAHKSSLERLDANERQLQTLAARIDGLGSGDGDAPGTSNLSSAIIDLSDRVAQAERIAEEAAALKADASGSADPSFVERTGERLRVLGDEIKRGGDQIRDLEGTIAKLSAQIDAAERRSAEGLQKVTETISELREQFSGDAQGAPPRQADAELAEEPQEESDVAQHEIDGDNDITASSPSSSESDESDEDPFAFADEIEAAIEETPDTSADFTFDLDDENEDEQDSEATSLLSDVQEIFGKKKPKRDVAGTAQLDAGFSPAAEEEPAEKTDEAQEDDLEALLADLEDDGGHSSETDGPAASAQSETPSESASGSREAKKAALFGGGALDDLDDNAEESDASDEPASKEDFLQAARRRAKEAAEEAEKEKRIRRKLTPKQRAILAARARQKRLTASAPGEKADNSDSKPAAETAATSSKPTSPHAAIDMEDDGDKSSGGIGKIVAGLRDKLPFIGKKDDDEDTQSEKEPTPAKSEDEDVAGNKAAFATLKSTAAARPVTLALGVAIFLAAAALFFLVKDLVFKSPASPGARQVESTQSPQSAESTAGETASLEEPATSLAVPAGPAIDPRSLYVEAMTALNEAEGNEETIAAINTLEEAAALGHPPAQLQLGELYKTGQGVDQDLGQARTWFRRAANGGNVLAMHRIGVMTARGDGGPADTAEAIGWFELAANRGLVDSQYNLGAIYHPSDNGEPSGVQDAGEAYYWYSLAAKNGDQQASPLAAGVAVALTQAERTQIDTQVAAWEAQTVDDAANEMAPAT